MARILAISLLLIVVYSWEEVKYFLRKLVFRVFRHESELTGQRERAQKTDGSVGILVVTATVPVGLVYFISHAQSIWVKLVWIGIALILVALFAIVSELLLRRGQLATPLVSLVSMFAPMVAAVADSANLPRKILAKFALFLSLPIFAGLLLRHLNRPAPESLIAELDLLTIVLICSLILRITVELLEHYFHLYKLERLFSYYRIVLGIVLAAILLTSGR